MQKIADKTNLLEGKKLQSISQQGLVDYVMSSLIKTTPSEEWGNEGALSYQMRRAITRSLLKGDGLIAVLDEERHED